ncbi:hypothetical protein HC928_01355 [bacterium]|nr:hypothetical protein [bacterium]
MMRQYDVLATAYETDLGASRNAGARLLKLHFANRLGLDESAVARLLDALSNNSDDYVPEFRVEELALLLETMIQEMQEDNDEPA